MTLWLVPWVLRNVAIIDLLSKRKYHLLPLYFIDSVAHSGHRSQASFELDPHRRGSLSR